jgi:hypothetical protein
MTTLELIAFLGRLKEKNMLGCWVEPADFEKIALDFQKQSNQPDWKEKSPLRNLMEGLDITPKP